MLTRLRELAVKIETTPGTAASGTYSAANAKFLVIDPTIEYDVPLFDREIVRGSLTNLEGLTGIKTARLRFALEMSGHASGTPDVPPWDLLLRACGFSSKSMSKATIGAISGGPFRHGETITGGTSSATAVVVHDTYDGQPRSISIPLPVRSLPAARRSRVR